MQSVHETIIRDIVDIIQGVKDSDEVQKVSGYNDKNSWKSITRKSDALTLVFPVIASRNTSYEAAAMISKAIERKAVTLLQMLFSAINITDSKDGIDYISKFHNNLDIGNMSVDKFMDTMDRFVKENALITEASRHEEYEKIKKDLSNMNFYFENNVNDESLNDYKVVNVEGTRILVKEETPIEFESNPYDRGDSLKDLKDTMNITKIGKDIKTGNLIDGDVKKANELVPTMVYVNFTTINKDTDYAIPSSIIIGVKAKLYAADSYDILNRLKIKNNDRNLALNLIKAGTREISFFKDFIFAVDAAKIDALSRSRKGSSSIDWKVLERRALKSRIKRSLFINNDAAAITTLVITQEEVEYLKKTEYIDVENPRVITPILDAYNLMGFVIVDEALEIAKFIFDSQDNMYEILTFNNLERESKDNTKKIINLMSKMSR